MNEIDQKVQAIITDDTGDVRQRVADATTEAIPQIRKVREAMEKALKSAVDAVKDSVPQERESVLREVIDGLHDGVARTANAASFAIEEAKSKQQTFAADDLHEALSDLDAASDLLKESVGNVVDESKDHLSDQSEALLEHAKLSAAALKGTVLGAFSTASGEPTKLAGEVIDAGKGLAERTKGELFPAIADALRSLADKVDKSTEKE